MSRDEGCAVGLGSREPGECAAEQSSRLVSYRHAKHSIMSPMRGPGLSTVYLRGADSRTNTE
jgi:hypothetical protein